MANAVVDNYGSELSCRCGEVIDLQELKEGIIDSFSSYDDSIEESKEFTCEHCWSVFNVTLEFDQVIEHYLSSHSVELISIHENEDLPFTRDTSIGQRVDLEDGNYYCLGYFYYVENNEVVNIFNAKTNEDQLSLDLMIA